MKNLLLSMLAAVTIFAVNAQATNDPVKPIASADPAAPYHNYSPAMASSPDKPLTSDWQNKQRKAIDAETTDAKLAAVVATEESAELLLSRVKGAYTTDPLTLTKIASVTQWVMLPDSWYNFLWDGPHAKGREVWVEALLDTAEDAKDLYVKIFCLEQLRWCGREDDIDDILEIGVESKYTAVKDLAETVARGLRKAK